MLSKLLCHVYVCVNSPNSSILSLVNLVAANGAPVLDLEPPMDALRVEFVKAGQSEDFLSLGIVSHTDNALVLMGLFAHIHCTCTLYVLIVLRQGQLREQIFVHRFDIVADKELIHMIFELLLIHIVHSLVHAHLMVSKVILSGSSHCRAYCAIVLSNVIRRQPLRALRQKICMSHHSRCTSTFTLLLLC